MKKTMFILLAGAALYASCSKDKNSPTPGGQAGLAGKWTQLSTHATGTIGGEPFDTTILADAGDYLDFRNDGHVYSRSQGQLDTSAYKVENNSKIVFTDPEEPTQTDTIQIKSLSNSSLVLFQKHIEGADLTEATLTLKR